MVKRDLFDIISPDPDVFDRIAAEPPPEDIFDRVQAKIASMPEVPENVKDLIKEEIEKLKPKERVIERVIEKKVIHPYPVHIEPKVVQAPPAPPQIVKEVRIEVLKPDTRQLVEQPEVDALKKKIADLEKKLSEVRKMADHPIVIHGGPGVIGIPAPEPNPEGYVLTVNGDRKAQWKESAGGASISGYTVNDLTTLKNLPADASLDELRQVLGTLLTELQA